MEGYLFQVWYRQKVDDQWQENTACVAALDAHNACHTVEVNTKGQVQITNIEEQGFIDFITYGHD